MKKHIRYRPSKASAGMSVAVGIIFIIIGFTLVLPATFGSGFLPVGLFGLAWTGIAVAITVVNGLYLFGKRDNTSFFGSYVSTDEETEEESEQERLKKLQSLYDQRLITAEEYEEKRKEILKEL